MKNEKKKQGLSEFFTYQYQAKLIHDAQMLENNYEGALIEYWKLFTANLIMCFEEDSQEEKNTILYENVKRILDSVRDDTVQREIIINGGQQNMSSKVSVISEMFLLIREAYHCWTSCDLGGSIRVFGLCP